MPQLVKQFDWSGVADPINSRGALPLRVAVYAAIARAIRSGHPGPGELLPNEPELCAAFGVSRTVIREALILLEEDLLVRTQRGVGRFVADELPTSGLEQVRPIEAMLSHDDAPTVRRLKCQEEGGTDFTTRGLVLSEEARTWIWESLVLRNDEPLALSQEWIPAGDIQQQISPRVTRELIQESSAAGVTLLSLLLDLLGGTLGPGACDVSVSTAGRERGQALQTRSSTPILVLTQRVLHEGRPLYLAKHMIRPEAGHLTVIQSTPM